MRIFAGMKSVLLLILTLGFIVDSHFKHPAMVFGGMEVYAQFDADISNDDPFQSDQEEFPEQGESGDSKEVEDPKKCNQLQLVFSPLSTSGKLEWAMMNIALAMDPHHQEIQQPPEFFI